MNYSGVGVIVENEAGEFLLHLRDGNTKNSTHQWCLVGGSLESGEDPLVAAIREVKEETNLHLQNPMLLHTFQWDDKTIALIKGDVDTRTEIMELGEGAGLQFFSKMEALTLLRSLTYSNPYLDQLKEYIKK